MTIILDAHTDLIAPGTVNDDIQGFYSLVDEPADAPADVHIEGSANAKVEEYNHYTCTSGISDPPADIVVKVSDHNGDELPVVMKKMPAITARKGFTSSVSFGIEFKKGIEKVQIECKAGNEMGEAMSTYDITVKGKLVMEILNTITNINLDTGSDKNSEKHEGPVENTRGRHISVIS